MKVQNLHLHSLMSPNSFKKDCERARFVRPYLSKSVQKRWPGAATEDILNKKGYADSNILQIPK